MSGSLFKRRRPQSRQPALKRGFVLPVVMVLLLVLALVGLFAARRAATVEEISNNVRVNQVANLAAQKALNYCESVVVDAEGDGTQYDAAITGKVRRSKVLSGADDLGAQWRTLANWGDNSTSRITVPVAEGKAAAAMNGAPEPHCMAEAMPDDQFLITARGLSANASFDANGMLQSGSEVWLQSILSPQVPVRSAEGGYE